MKTDVHARRWSSRVQLDRELVAGPVGALDRGVGLAVHGPALQGRERAVANGHAYGVGVPSMCSAGRARDVVRVDLTNGNA